MVFVAEFNELIFSTRYVQKEIILREAAGHNNVAGAMVDHWRLTTLTGHQREYPYNNIDRNVCMQ